MKERQQCWMCYARNGHIAWVVVSALSLAACGGGGSSSEAPAPGDGGLVEAGFSEPADALLHATIVPLFGMERRRLPSVSAACVDAGSMRTESIFVDSPYAASGSIGGAKVIYDECRDGSKVVNGQLAVAAESGGGASYTRFGTESGQPLVVERGSSVITYDGFSHFCGLGCASVDGVPTREMQSDLGFDVQESGGGGESFVRGTDTQTFVQRWRQDYPAAGQTMFWMEGFLSYELKGECLAAAEYSVPDETRSPVRGAGGGGSKAVFGSGLLRMERDGTSAEAVYSPSGVTITVAGVGESFTWEQVFDAWVDRCNLSL